MNTQNPTHATGHPKRPDGKIQTTQRKNGMNFKNVKLWGLGALVSISSLAQAQSNDSLAARLEELDQVTAAKAPKVSAGEDGFGLSSADGAYSIKFRNFAQPQAVHILGEVGAGAAPGINTYSIKRLQTDLVVGLGKRFEYRAHVNFAAGTADLLDVNLDWKILPEFSIRVGKFKPPTGLERLISSPRAPFVEGSFVTLLQPNRDVGAQVFGSVRQGLLEYQAGIFNGARDGQNNATDNNEEKDLYGRLFSHPFSGTGNAWLAGFGAGVSGSYGKQAQYNNPAVAAAGTAPYVPAVTNGIASYSTGRQGFFSYNAVDTSVGAVIRYSPQAYYYAGPLGIIAEYTATTQTLARNGVARELTNTAWAFTSSLFVTGEKNSYKGIKVRKANAFPSLESFGALEILARVSGIAIDDAAFEPVSANQTQTYANPAAQASGALQYGFAVKWYLNNSVNLFTGWENTKFEGGAGTAATASVAAAPTDRQTESVLTAAFNVSF